jgi:hypothetical protein
MIFKTYPENKPPDRLGVYLVLVNQYDQALQCTWHSDGFYNDRGVKIKGVIAFAENPKKSEVKISDSQ